MSRVCKISCVGVPVLFLGAFLFAQMPASTASHVQVARYDGADWSLKGEGLVCCPCTVPCPCRTNGAPSYGHCEATLYLMIREGQYGAVSLNGMQVVDTGGMCAVSGQSLAALYFDRSSTPAQQSAFMKLVASFSPRQAAGFPFVRIVPFNTQIISDHLFKVFIPGILEMVVDRNWGQSAPPMPEVAAQDNYSNVLQYAQNLQYRMHDPEAGVNFDYSRRQANYRRIDLTVQQYRSKAMLIQFIDGKGWFSPEQMALIRAQHLTIPRLETMRQEALRLRDAGNH